MKNSEKIVKKSSEVTDSNMEMAAKETHSIKNSHIDIKSKGVSFDGTWKNRGWQAKAGVIPVGK